MNWAKVYDDSDVVTGRVNIDLLTEIGVSGPDSNGKYQVQGLRVVTWVNSFKSTSHLLSPNLDTREEALAEIDRLLLDGSRQ